MNTHSKVWKDHEIRGILPDGSIYLKTGVRRKYFGEHISPNELESHINEELLIYQKAEKYYKYIEGTDDYENN